MLLLSSNLSHPTLGAEFVSRFGRGALSPFLDIAVQDAPGDFSLEALSGAAAIASRERHPNQKTRVAFDGLPYPGVVGRPDRSPSFEYSAGIAGSDLSLLSEKGGWEDMVKLRISTASGMVQEFNGPFNLWAFDRPNPNDCLGEGNLLRAETHPDGPLYWHAGKDVGFCPGGSIKNAHFGLSKERFVVIRDGDVNCAIDDVMGFSDSSYKWGHFKR